MADISKITVGSTTYNVKDSGAVRDYAGRLYYGTCSTAQATKAKVVTVSDTSFSLTTGVAIAVKFSEASAKSNMTISVNNTTACTVVQYGTTACSSGTTTTGWPAGAVVVFVYDGTYWVRSFFSNTTYSAMTQTELDTGTATTGRTISASLFVTNAENPSNKVTSLSSSSTDTQYPSAKCVYDAIQAGGGGGATTATTVTIATSDWSSLSCTKTVSRVTSSNNVIVSPAPASLDNYASAGVKCTAQGTDSLTFSCSSTPSSSLTVNVLILG